MEMPPSKDSYSLMVIQKGYNNCRALLQRMLYDTPVPEIMLYATPIS
jgi:hypothetical protein